MTLLDGRVVLITGAGRGLGREHALQLAAEGARVVVNDVGGAMDGSGSDETAAESVVSEIRAQGGEAVPDAHDVASWEGGERMVQTAIDAYGRLDVLVNNAGILRDRTLVNMTEDEWDAVIRVHLKGHFVPTRFAALHWRSRHKAGDDVKAAVINTSSTSGLLGNPGQSNYGAAKAGIAAFTVITAQELARYGVRVNCIAPAARTRLTEATPGLSDVVQPPSEGFDEWDPGNVSPLVVVLAAEDCTITGRTFFVRGGVVQFFQPWSLGARAERDARWSPAELATEIKALVD